MKLASSLEAAWEKAGLEVLFDERDERPGVKLKDHDLIGCPVRVVVGGKGLKEGIVEVKLRTAPKEGMEKVPVANVEARVLELVQGLLAQARSAADAIG